MKSECVIKSLKSDFKDIGIVFGAIIGIVTVCYLVINFGPTLANMIPKLSAYDGFIIFGVIFTILGFISNLYTSKESLTKYGTFSSYFVSLISIAFLFVAYCFISGFNYISYNFYYPDINLICLIFIIINIVLTPFALAYVRCKE